MTDTADLGFPGTSKVRRTIRHPSSSSVRVQQLFLSNSFYGGKLEERRRQMVGGGTEVQGTSTRLFQAEHFQHLLNKVVSALPDQLEVPGAALR